MGIGDPYAHSDEDRRQPDFARDVGESIDRTVNNAGTSAYVGGMQVLTSGFGKGLLATAAFATVAIVGAAIVMPAAISLAPGLGVAEAITGGLTVAGNTLLGSGAGLAVLAGGGAIGSLVAAHSENTRLGKEAAEARAAQYACERNCTAPDTADTGPEYDSGLSYRPAANRTASRGGRE